MKNLLYLLPTALLIACGGEEESSTNESTQEITEQDTSSVDTTAVIEEAEETFYFEDYAQYNTKTALYEAYDKEHLTDEVTYYAEGEVRMETTILTDPVSGNLIQFTWSEEDPEKLNFIETWSRTWKFDNDQKQKVETKEGLYTGMPLSELVEWNDGVHFDFYGFGWDYEGGIQVPKDCKLTKANVGVTLTLEDDGGNHIDLLGDILFNSADEKVQGAPIVIGTIAYSAD